MTGPATWRSRWPRGRQDRRGVALVFRQSAKGGGIDGAAYRRHTALARGARLIFTAHVGRMMRYRVFGLHVGLRSGIFAGAILVAAGVTPVHAQSGDPISPPANTVVPADSPASSDHVRKPTEPPPFDSSRPAARAARVKATPPPAPAPEHRAAQGTDDAIGTVGGAANGRIAAARDIAPARGSEQAVRRGRGTSMARDGGRSGGGAGYASRSRLAPDGAPALGRSVGGAGDGASFGTGGGAAKGRISAARDIAPARGSNTPSSRGRATSTARDDGRSVGGAGDGCRPRIAPDGARALERSVGGAGDGASFRIAPDDAAALGAGQSHRHRFAGALERGSAPRAVAGATPAA